MDLTTAWQKVASAGATVELENRSNRPVLLKSAASEPAALADGDEVLSAGGDLRTYDAPLPNDLYARAQSPLGASLGVMQIGAASSGGGGGGGGAATIADGADVTQGAKADAVWDGAAAAPTGQALLKYIAAKTEAVRAAIASNVATALPAGTNSIGTVVVAKPTNLATGQVSVATTAGGTQIVPQRAGRKGTLIIQEGTTLVRLGASGVTTSTGIPLPGVQYASVFVDGEAAVYGIVGAGTQTVSYLEVY